MALKSRVQSFIVVVGIEKFSIVEVSEDKGSE
jgi:hypothetical protein